MRNLRLHVSQVYHAEFEDVIGTIDTVDTLAPVAPPRGAQQDLPHRILRKLKTSINSYIINGRLKPEFNNIILDKEYDLLFFICRSPLDLICLQALQHWREKCQKAVCWLDEVWVKSLENSRGELELLKQFDGVFIPMFKESD
jgi:hypothetical protein